MNLDEKFILTITAGSHLSVHCFMLVFPSILLVLKDEFSVGLDIVGLDILGFIATISALMFGIGAIPAGFFESKVGGRVLLLIYQAGTIVATMVIVMSQSLWMLTTGLALLGLFCSIYHPAGLTLLSRRLKILSIGMAIHGVAGSLGLALGPLFAGAAAEFGSWRVSYLIWIILQGILVFVTFFMIKRRNEPIENDTKKEIFEIKDKRSIVLYYVMSTALGFSFGGFTTYMPSLFGSQTTGIFALLPETLKAGFFTTLVFTSGILGQTIGGFVGDRYSRSFLLFWIVILNMPFLLLMGYTSGWSLLISSILLGIVHFLNQPVSNALLAELTPSSHRGVGYGISFFLSFGIGGIAPAVCGWITNQYSIEMVFPFMAISLIPAVIAGWCLMKRKNQTP